MKEIKAAMIGLGSVNKNLLRILSDKADILSGKYGLSFKIVVVADSSGVAVNEDGFDMLSLVDHKQNGNSVSGLAGYTHASACDAVTSTALDIIFEASPVDFETGGEGLELARAALSKGISVVLANKGPVVKAHSELRSLARENGAGFKYSATVCGGLPVLNIGERDLIAGNISKLSGVFNGTSNFIFDALANGMSFDDAIIEAQNVGAAEADPSLDTGGWDAAFKLLIIANSILDANIELGDIDVEGIEDITPEMLAAESSAGNIIKLVASFEDGNYSVKPAVVSKDTFLGSCSG
ncbi:MAG: homoserine dehydrogenase, partial [Kordiimonadaceae bacterium]|nr:homoserine dehydrogenase [Kordiimonadaceae bacterium]